MEENRNSILDDSGAFGGKGGGRSADRDGSLSSSSPAHHSNPFGDECGVFESRREVWNEDVVVGGGCGYNRSDNGDERMVVVRMFSFSSLLYLPSCSFHSYSPSICIANLLFDPDLI